MSWVVIVGFPGVGKTTVGLAFSDKFGIQHVDVDTEIELESKRSITDLIRVEGVDKFRQKEYEAIKKFVDSNKHSKQGILLTVGGGAFTFEPTRELIRDNFYIIWLEASDRFIALRVLGDELRALSEGKSVARPVLVKKPNNTYSISEIENYVAELRKNRRGVYDLADLKVWTDWIDSSGIARVLKGELDLSQVSKKNDLDVVILPFSVANDPGKINQVVIGNGLVGESGNRIKKAFPGLSKFAVIIDEQVNKLWREKIDLGLQTTSGIEFKKFIVPSGEESKRLSLVEAISNQMLSGGIGRNDVVVAIGGGVVGDLAGMIASIYMRGIGLVHMPTTVVAQVDSAIGGKTGVNLSGAKNSLGTFYTARLVLSDLEFLKTLPQREYVSGLVEVIKYGLICSTDFVDWFETNIGKILNREVLCLKELVEFSSKTKLEIVVEDFRDITGRRALLNFGHTVGHALEKLSGYGELLHGEAVALGMVVAVEFGEARGVTEAGVKQRVVSLLKTLGLNTAIDQKLLSESRELWREVLMADKKRVDEKINFVFLEKIGVSKVMSVNITELLVNLLGLSK